MRFSGLASGIDTESIIRDMMQINRMPLTKVTQKKQYTEWQVANYRSTNLDLNKFSNNIFSNMILSDSFTKKTMDISNPGALGVKNINSTSDFSGTIRVGQLAKNSTMQGEKKAELEGKSSSSTLKDLGFVAEGGEISINIDAIGADGVMPPKNEDGTRGKTLTFQSTDSLDTVLDRINKETGITAFFDSQSGRIGISSKHSGELEGGGSEIVIEGDLATALGINNGGPVDEISRVTFDKGKNAIFEFNGMQMKRSSNKFTINGFEFTLKEKTTELESVKDGNGNDTGEVKLADGGPTITFSSAPDTDSIVDNIVKFVDEYNKLIESLNEKIREPKYRDFHPLSTEEKGEMKEKEIELWEEKAMSGTLRNDPIISSMLSEMRTALMGSVGGDDKQALKNIGITTSSNYLDNGKLIIDEKKLREAINEDPNKVHQLFAADGKKETVIIDGKEREVDNRGFARRIREAVQDAEKKITKHAGGATATNDNFTLGKGLIDMDKQIVRFEDRLKMTENRLWRQFTAMEVAIQKANAQSASLMNAFGGM